MISGIYRITVSRPGRPDLFYIGQAKVMTERWRVHRAALKRGDHENWRLQALFNKYGIGAFRFEISLVCQVENLTLYEQALLDFYVSSQKRNVLNIRRECVSSSAGIKISEETRAKMSAAKKGKPGRKWTDEQKAKVSATKKGRPAHRNWVEATKKANTGRKHTPEEIERRIAPLRGFVHSPETRARMRDAAHRRAQR